MSLLIPATGATAKGRSDRSEVTVQIREGHVIATTFIATSLPSVRALLGNPSRVAEIEGRGSEVTSRQKGLCIESNVTAPSGVGKIRYTSLSCPTSDGFRGSLVSSKQIRQMEARWTLRQAGEWVEVSYDLYVVPRIKVPQRLVALLSKRGVRRLLEAVRNELEQGPASVTPN
jgi:hypothetical protein